MPPADPCAPFRKAIAEAAARISWPADLLEAQVRVESGGDPFALRVEPAFFNQYLRNTPKLGPYATLAACSFGLCQILLQTALEDGYGGRPETLFDPVVNLSVSARHLEKLRRQVVQMAPADTFLSTAADVPPLLAQAVLASWNGGLRANVVSPFRNIRYVERVIAEWKTIKAEREGKRA